MVGDVDSMDVLGADVPALIGVGLSGVEDGNRLARIDPGLQLGRIGRGDVCIDIRKHVSAHG